LKFRPRSIDDSSSVSFTEDGDIMQAVGELTLLFSEELGERPKPRVSSGFSGTSTPAISIHFLFSALVLSLEKLESTSMSMAVSWYSTAC
jgi:membrane-bound acyltransferase YfiQ involved in biofilm formation